MNTLGEWRAHLRTQLQPISDTAALDAQVLLARLLQRDRAWVLAHPEAKISPAQQKQLTEQLNRLQNGAPLPYVLGEWEFYALSFEVTPAVLIPRPETELLVDTALAWLRAHPTRTRVADIGTGSGCIAVALAHQHPSLHVLAADISENALLVAARNATRHHVETRIQFGYGDLLENVPAPLDMICANLPYLPSPTLPTLDVSTREPTLALDGGADGLRLIDRLLAQSVEKLTSGGIILLEVDASHGETAPALARERFPKAHIEMKRDLAGKPRLVTIESR